MKSADDAMQMTMFGVQVCVTVASAKITVHLEETKVLPWLKDMQEDLRSGKLPSRISQLICRTSGLCRVQRNGQESLFEAMVCTGCSPATV